MNTEELMKLADAYASAETSFWFGQEKANTTVDTDARRNRDEARAALEAALSAKDVNSTHTLERLVRIMGTFDLATGHADTFDDVLDALESELRDVLGYYRGALSAKQGEQKACGYDETTGNCTSNPCCHPAQSVNAQEPCDMGQMCLNCQPRGLNGECPDKAPKAKQEAVACPYCSASATLGAVYFDQNCKGCVKRMTRPAPSVNAQERISELEAECERLNQQAELQYQHDTKEIEELQAKNAQLLRDAKRYRWLHERRYKDGGDLCTQVANGYDNFGMDMDAAVDAAIAAVQSNASTHELNSANSLE